MTTPLEEIAMIGDGETVALITRYGSVDWLCLPRFDSPACCASLLGSPEHGHWSIRPDGEIVKAEHRYRDDTMILETDLATEDGAIRIVDFMPIREKSPVLVRIVVGLSGTVKVRSRAAFRFDYGNMPPWITRRDDGIVMHVGPDEAVLTGPEGAEIRDSTVEWELTVSGGDRCPFDVHYSGVESPRPERIDPQEALEKTEAYWRDWIGRFDGKVEHPEAFRRSLLTLKALIHRPTGGLVAAPTTSLPEKPGGTMNWDYRFCWLRDATFTLTALVDCGYTDEAKAWRDWILRAVAGAPDRMQIMYRVDGSRRLDEAELDWLPGYRFAKPVRIGNAAAGQLQLDVFGELLNTLHLSEEAGMDRSDQGRYLERSIIDHLKTVWVKPDAGLWESRGNPRHYTYSKAMTWVAFDRFLAGSGGDELGEEERKEIEGLRDHIHDVICQEGYNPGMGSFTSFFGGEMVDASLLLLPKVGFLPVEDERIANTIAKVEEVLVTGGLVHRHRLPGLLPEGAFIACSFWLADCQLLQGRRDDAARTIKRVLDIRSDVGLLSEEYEMPSERLCSNYPQALSHLAMVNSLLALSEYDRGLYSEKKATQ